MTQVNKQNKNLQRLRTIKKPINEQDSKILESLLRIYKEMERLQGDFIMLPNGTHHLGCIIAELEIMFSEIRELQAENGDLQIEISYIEFLLKIFNEMHQNFKSLDELEKLHSGYDGYSTMKENVN